MTEHLCVAGPRCRDYDRTTETAAVTTDLPLCDADLGHAAMAVSRLVLDYRDLENLLPKTISEWSDGQPGHSGEAPIPLRLNVEALQREIWHLTTAWAEVLADTHRLADPPAPVRMGRAVLDAVTVIEPRITILAAIGVTQFASYPHDDEAVIFGTRQPVVFGRYPRTITLSYITGAQGLLDMAHAHERARTILGLTRDIRHLPGHCQAKRCGRAELYQERGSDTVWCGHCGNTMTRDDYEAYGNIFQVAS